MKSELESLMQLCRGLGAGEAQARVMADQLMKRCDQLATERRWTREAAMAHLLTLVTKGARGEAPAGFEGVSKPNPPKTH